MNRTSIAWVVNPDGSQGFTWNPVIGCKAVSPGCSACYAARLASTRLAHLPDYAGLAHDGKWTGEVRFRPERLAEPLHRKKPCSIFLNDMGDTFHESITNEQIAAMFGVMAATPHITYHVLTKRAKRMREWFEWLASTKESGWEASNCKGYASFRMTDTQDKTRRLGQKIRGLDWPLPNVRLGVTVENQAAADERIPLLLQTPAACRFLSVEPMLEAITLTHPEMHAWPETEPTHPTANPKEWDDWKYWMARGRGILWCIVGGESGSRARPFHVEWARSIRDQCKAAGVACFVKQMTIDGKLVKELGDFPVDLRIQEFPNGNA